MPNLLPHTLWITGPKGTKKLPVVDGLVAKATLATLAIAVGPGFRLHLAGATYGVFEVGNGNLAIRKAKARIHAPRSGVNGRTKKDYYQAF